MFKQYKLRNYNFLLIAYVTALTILGIMIIGSAKSSVQNKQILGFVMGLIIMVVVSVIDFSFLLRFVWIYYVGMIGILLLVRFSGLGDDAGGATRWIEIGGIRFQPSELAKIVIILFFTY